MPSEANLKVMEALQEEAYKGIIRIDAETMNLIGVRPGEIVEIEGARITAGIVDRAYPTDVGQSVIRMDGIIRRNAKTGIGEYVKVRRADVKEAKTVQVAPAQKGVMIQADPELFKRSLLGRAVLKGDIISPGGTKRRRRTMSDSPYGDIFEVFEHGFMGSFGFGGLKFVIVNSNPKGVVIISDQTEITLSSKAIEVYEEKVPDVTYEDIGGLDDEIKKIREMVELPLRHPEIFERLGVQPPGGVLLHGLPGSGKTLLAKAVANESDANFLLINGPEIVNKFYGESERKLRDIFEDAEKNSPSIIFIDEIDAIAPKREDTHGEVERRIVSTLLVLLDGLKSRGKIIVIAATNRPNSIDPALRRPGRFDREIVIGAPNRKGRLEVLNVHTRNMPLEGVSLEELADITHGFVGADLLALCKEAALSVLRRLIVELRLEQKEKIPQETLEKIKVTKNDFMEALRLVRPSGLREILIETPNVGWKDIGGLEKQKQELIEAVEWPIKNPEAFKRIGIKAPKGILLYGPPGTGKTMIAKAAAKESDANFILVKGPELLDMWVGQSLPYNEEILIRKNGNVMHKKIGDIVEGKEEVDVLCFDKDLRVNFSPIEDFIKHKTKSQLVEVTTKTGRKIKVTMDHSLFSFVNGKIVSTPTGYLIPYESYIAIPRRLNLPREQLNHLNLYNGFKEDRSVFIVGASDHLKRAKKLLGNDTVAKLLNISKKYLSDILSRDLPVSLPCFIDLMTRAKLAVDHAEMRVKLKGSTHTYPANFAIDSNFWRLIGVWVAEGDFEEYMVRIHNKHPEIRSDVKQICNQYHFNFSENEDGIFITSKLVKKIFQEILCLGTGAYAKKIPTCMFTLDKKSKANFLKGYFSGDGANYPKADGKFGIESSTISKTLANDLLYILLDFGIIATNYLVNKEPHNQQYRLSILGVEHFKRFLEIGFIDTLRNERITQYIKSRKWSRSDLIPLSGGVLSLATICNNPINNVTIGKDRMKQMLQICDADHSKYKEYWDIVEGDIYFDLVKEIKTIDKEEFVYDISVPDGQNFVAGFGGIFAHNSEKGVRKIFEKARQVAPTIIFFDEVDAIAPRRGIEVGNKVTERMVNTLLVEMDGLEELNDVVIIAASNRPDIIDPALLRPGRFDRLLLLGPPDTPAREQIFKLHTKNMPLAKDVDLLNMAEQTEGYVGADIEAICREAGLLSLRADINTKEVTKKFFDEALTRVTPSVTEEAMSAYTEIEGEYLKKARAGLVKDIPSYLG